jgi:azurin
MKLSALLFCVLLIPAAASAAQEPPPTAAKSPGKAAAAKGAARTIEITGTEQMKFDKTSLTARPGEKLRIVLKAVGTLPKTVMGHNFVLLKPDASPLEVNNAAFAARATDFIPESMKDKIYAYSPLAGGGETVEVTFAAPAKPGTYTYLCTFPGHFAMGMKGTLVVK